MSTVADHLQRLPFQDYHVVWKGEQSDAFGPHVTVNELVLPNDQAFFDSWDEDSPSPFVSLRDSNSDWCPFFGTVRNMNSLFDRALAVFDLTMDDQGWGDVGFYFDSTNQMVHLTTNGLEDFDDEGAHAWVAFPYTDSIQGISRKLGSMESQGEEMTPSHTISTNFFNSRLEGPWWAWYEAMYPDDEDSKINPEVYMFGKSEFMKMYNRPLSDIKYFRGKLR